MLEATKGLIEAKVSFIELFSFARLSYRPWLGKGRKYAEEDVVTTLLWFICYPT